MTWETDITGPHEMRLLFFFFLRKKHKMVISTKSPRACASG